MWEEEWTDITSLRTPSKFDYNITICQSNRILSPSRVIVRTAIQTEGNEFGQNGYFDTTRFGPIK